ncbi:hypothetical protein ACP70R_024276 [Stipagrostis hirtigluma subsp. patula]
MCLLGFLHSDSTSDAEFETIVTMEDLKSRQAKAGSDKLVVLEFWARWSVPSGCVLDSFKELAQTFKTRAEFYALDVDKSMPVASFYKVESLPTFVLLRGDKILGKVLGIDTEELKESIEQALQEEQAAAQEEH